MSTANKQKKKGTPGQVRSWDRKRRRQKERREQLKQQASQEGITVEQLTWRLQKEADEAVKEAKKRPVQKPPDRYYNWY